jgi:hypothetical protein
MKRYKLTSDKTLVDTRDGKTYTFEKVKSERKGRITSVTFRMKDGFEVSAALYAIDQNGHDLGLGGTPVKKAKAPTKQADPPLTQTIGTFSSATLTPGSLILMTRDELLQIHHALQSAADITLRRVVESLK